MRSKLAVVACIVAAFALPSSPAVANDSVKGVCYDIVLPFGDVSDPYECECLAGINGVEISPPPPTITITICHAEINP